MILVSNQGRSQSFLLLSPSQIEVLGGGGGEGGGSKHRPINNILQHSRSFVK